MLNFFIRHPTLANLCMVSFLLLGLSSLGTLKRETFPEFTNPFVIATVVYPGASPSEVEESLCMRMEDAVDGLSNIEETRCEAVEGLGSLIVKLDGKADVGRMLVDIQTEINAIKDFPLEIEPPVVKEMDWAEPVVDIAISAPASWPDLKAYAEQLKHTLKVDYGVAIVTVSGFSDHQLRVELDHTALRRLNLSVTDVADAISNQNINLPAGTIELFEKNLLIRFDQRKRDPVALAKTVIAADPKGSVVYLGDIATITDRFELDEEKILFNNLPSAVLKISKNKADDALRIKASVQQFVDDQLLIAPTGVQLTLTNDMSSLLNDRLTMMLKNGWQGIILVFLSMWLFFSLRYSFWIAAGLPVAFMGGLFLMSVVGLSINVMTLVGLLMAIGIMMDDAIVIAESIASHLERGMNADQAVIEGVKKAAPGVISSFFTTIFVLGSLMWLDGQMGAVLSVVPMALLLVLCISLIEAFLILPNHLRHTLQHQPIEKPVSGLKARFLASFENFRLYKLVPAVAWVVKWRYASLGVVFALFLMSLSLVVSGALKFTAFPELDGDIAEARLILPPGSSLSQTEAMVEEIVNAATLVGQQFTKDNNEPQALIHDITAQYNFNANAGEVGPHVATVRLDLLSAEVRNSYIEDFISAWRDKVGEQALPVSLAFTQPTMGPAGRAIEVRLQHSDLDTLKAASVDLQNYLGQFSGVNSILDDMRPGKEEVVVSLRNGAESFNINGQLVAQQLRAAYQGAIADEFQLGAENIQIDVRLNKLQAGNLQSLANFPIVLNDGNQVPLSAVANIEYQRAYVRIQRINGLRTVTVMADVDSRKANTSEVMSLVQGEFLPTLVAKYSGLRIDFEGEAKESAKVGASLMKSFGIGIFGVFAILSFQFRSYLEPVIVLTVIPMALIGVLWGHFLLGHSLSMPSILGFISLAGIVTNDSILLVQYIRHHLDDGDDVYDAVVSASKERFRAVFLTSLTTAAGLLPLLLETSLQAQVVQPIVVSIVFGICASTLMVLFIIPAAYAILADWNLVHKHQRLD
ncbi:efflux RND transporter permease subunit [Agarivorans sp. TSD2052]|uniref:efflux RND transporter permease subunit n=1 Tax=Agarivorans sp. TSD2052 TaxID=2937286 RepID=UPI0020105917|nr:efflux RND transporter permease subunit [Agarivorans sp. TSD2052]UPW20617.1 efflux RND transporter permease subunit [Agarivorans sp. TSD2052]